MGLAWLSLFFSWNVHMVVEAHKVLKKRRLRHKSVLDEPFQNAEDRHSPVARPTAVDIFKFLSEKEENYSTVIKEIGESAKKRKLSDSASRSKSCSDILATNILTLDHSPRQRRRLSISAMFIKEQPELDTAENEGLILLLDSSQNPEPDEHQSNDFVEKSSCSSDSERDCIFMAEPNADIKEESVQHPSGGATRFTISKVTEDNLIGDKDEKG